MERLDALAIVNRLEAAYPNERWTGPRVDQYIDGIIDLPAGAAGTALARLVKTASKAPTVADFRAAVRAIDTRDSRPTHCPDCDGCGWIEAEPLTVDGHTYTQVAPCGCENGRRVA